MCFALVWIKQGIAVRLPVLQGTGYVNETTLRDADDPLVL